MSNSVFKFAFICGVTLMAPLALAQGDATRGETLAAVCAACHGEDGNSVVPNFPKLAGTGESYMLKQLIDIKQNVRVVPEMTGILEGLSDQDMADLAAFYDEKAMQLSGAQPLEVQVNSGEKVDGMKLGENVYRAGTSETSLPACTGCHSPRGLGNDPAGFPRLGGQHAQYIEKQLRDFRAGNRTNDAEGVMRTIAKNMTDAEIVALANYIAGLN